MARSLVASFVEEQPALDLDLAGAEPDTAIDPRLAALAVTALAEGTLAHLANPGSVGIRLVGECLGMLSIHGTRLAQSHGSDAVSRSRVWLLHAARYLEVRRRHPGGRRFPWNAYRRRPGPDRHLIPARWG